MYSNFREAAGANRRSFAGVLVVLLLLMFAGQSHAGLITVFGSGLDDDGTTISVSATFDTDDATVVNSIQYSVSGLITGTHYDTDGMTELASYSSSSLYIYVDPDDDVIFITATDGITARMNAYFSDGVILDASLNNINQTILSQSSSIILSMINDTYTDLIGTRTDNTLTVVPEPTTLALLAGGILLLKDRRKKESVGVAM